MKVGTSENKTITILVNQCFECGDTSTDIHQHHVIPRSKGGTKTIPLCETCHGLVHNKKFLHHSKLISDSIQDKKKSGKRYSKTIPVGYKLEEGILVVDRRDIQLIQRIQQLHIRGHSYNSISKLFNSEGIKTKQGKEWNKVLVRHYALCNVVGEVGNIESEIVKVKKESIKEEQPNFHKFFKL